MLAERPAERGAAGTNRPPDFTRKQSLFLWVMEERRNVLSTEKGICESSENGRERAMI